MTGAGSGSRFWIQLTSVIAILALLVWSFHDLRLARLAEFLGRLGPLSAILILLPQVGAIACETAGWRAAFAQIGSKVSYRALLWVRLSTEALALSVPGGALVAEPFKLPLLVRHARVDSATSAAAIGARKYLGITSQAAFILLAAALGSQSLALHSASHSFGLNLPMWIAFSGGAVGGSALLIRVLLSRGTAASGVRRLLARLPSQKLRQKLAANGAAFVRTDGKLQSFFASGLHAEAKTTLWFLLGWTFESLETFLLLRLLGADLSFSGAVGMEVAVSLMRSVAFFSPAGLGVQDAGYALFLRAFAIQDATELAAAFSLLKRSKEVLLIGLGYALLAGDSRAGRPFRAAAKNATAGG